MNIRIKFLCVRMFLFPLGAYLGVKLLGHMLSVCLTFGEAAKLFFKVAAPYYIPTSNEWKLPFLYIIVIMCPFDKRINVSTNGVSFLFWFVFPNYQ